MAVNFFGAAYPTYLAIEHLIARRGTIAYVTSGAGHLPMAGYLGYSASVARVPTSAVAVRCLDAIVGRQRTLDLSPRIQKLAGPLRAVLPDLVDHRIYDRAVRMRSAFDANAEGRQPGQH